jgi:peptidoglycan/LPS O-acetylase OafA/YrhL
VPEPVKRSQRYMPGLDGLRAVAVLAVVAYHLGLGWAPGGLLGVGVFFTLSGYLITDLLLGQRNNGGVRLGEFWLRRARRLLPALFLVLIVVTIWVSLTDRSQLGEVRGQVWAASIYVSNWWQIFQHVSYFARFGPPSPLNHLWSLAVEEQFYLVWPWLLLLGLHFVRERKRPVRIHPRLAAVTLALAVASAVEMAVLYHPAFDSSRVYDGTDTRAFGLLFGAALAMVWPSRQLTTHITPRARQILDLVGVVGLVTIVVLVWRTNQYSAFPYRGGMVVLSVATVLAVAALAHPATRVGVALGWGPLRWLGVRSYGIYLWHAPVIVLTTPTVGGAVEFPRGVLQVAGTITLAALSWRFVEEPIRRGALRRLWARARSANWRPRAMPRRGRVGLAGALACVVLACVGLAGVTPPAPVTSVTAAIRVGPPQIQPPPATGPVSIATRGPGSGSRTNSVSVDSNQPSGAPTTSGPLRTSCRAVVHIGDSTSEGMVSPDYLPDRTQRLAAQYARVGATQQHLEISGATSIVETLPGGTNAYDVARSLVSNGYRGCWVLALGTNDTADVFVGSSVTLTTRIDKMMSAIGHQPVMWVNAKSLVASGPYSEANMSSWNAALAQACSRYPNMRIFDWASAARDGWFIPDGIHYTSPGYAARGHLIANALARAFPASAQAGASPCLVHAQLK